MPNQLYTDRPTSPIIERLKTINLYATCGDQEPATKTITDTAEASGLGNATYSKAATLTPITDVRIAILNLIALWSATIDSDDGTHDLRCRVYIDVQDAAHMIIDATCTTTGAQSSVQTLNSSTLATIFNLVKDFTSHTYYFYFWSPGNHSPVISATDFGAYVGSNSTATCGVPCISFTSPVPCEIQIRTLMSNGTGSAIAYCFIGDAGYYDAGFAYTDGGLAYGTATAGSSATCSWTWQLLPANNAMILYMKAASAATYGLIQDMICYIKRWN